MATAAPATWTRATPLPTWGHIAAPILVAAAFLIRLPHFGDPALMIDEQFYLLVGDRMLHGSLPFVDIWDRKPIGLFLIYAACRLLGGEGFVQYQVVATCFAAATAMVIHRIARPVAGEPGALVAGLLYLLWIEIPEGGGGQAPVFYNLFMAAAAMLVIEATAMKDRRPFRARSRAAMALVGLAIQIKYTAAIEGLFFGSVLATSVAARAERIGPALTEIAWLALIALTPTLIAFSCYAALGHADAFWFANFGSIFLRSASSPLELGYRLFQAALRLAPLGCAIAAGAWHLRHDHRAATRRWQLFMIGWMAAALAGFFSVGVLYGHYLLPVLVPFIAASAPIFRRWPSGWGAAALLAWLPLLFLHYPDFATTTRRQQEIARLTALVPGDVSTRCLQMFDGPPILYYTTRACTLSRFVFPDHLSAAIEAPAIGVDPAAELRRILARRPLAVTISDQNVRPPNVATFAIMRAALQRDYVLRGRAPFDGRLIDVWTLR